MSIELKPLNEQVILITGASSGIGLVTAKAAAAGGAKVILVSRNFDALDRAVSEIKSQGGDATFAVADVADKDALRQAAQSGVALFGRIDTWVNNAGVSIYGKIEETTADDDRRLFETNFWGVVNGSRLAVEYLRNTGGALINLGSEVSDVAVPIQGVYSASKHAVMGFTDALRNELSSDGYPISVTLIKPAAIDTPYPRHAQNVTGQEATLPSPVYAPELVADQILHAATHPVRDLYVGGGGRLMASLGQHLPKVMDWIAEKFMIGQQLKDAPADTQDQGLHSSAGGHAERGPVGDDHTVREHSLYGVVSRNALTVSLITAGVGVAAAYLLLRGEKKPTTADRVRGVVDRLREVGKTATGRASDLGQQASDIGQQAGTRAKHAAQQAAAAARKAGSSARDAGSSAARQASAAGKQGRGVVDSAGKVAGSASQFARTAFDLVRDALPKDVGDTVQTAAKSARRKAEAAMR